MNGAADGDVRNAAFSVAICTVNRLALVRETIVATLAQLDGFPRGRLVMIDNGSTDGTVEYLAALAARDTRVLFVREPEPGLYFARVRAIREAVGDIIVFLDDDAVPDDGWLLGILRPLVREPGIGVCGSIARPRWLAPRPDWFPERFLDEFAAFRHSGRRLSCSFPSYPPGLGLAVRRHPCLGLFAHPARMAAPLGRKSTDDSKPIYSGEDTDLCEIYARNGFQVIVEDAPGVAHAIHGSRLTPDWFRRRFRSEGHGRIYLCRRFGRPVVSALTWKMFAAWPLLALLRLASPLLRVQRRMLVMAYYEKSTGAWLEAVGGPRVEPWPFRVEADEA
ncbi:MAG: glycosyltransferase family 2 protein [Alphaproteobacteria bacterium]|nr:glycosyltransferase family 2 protein [Alphaproteobacteria bacterium]